MFRSPATQLERDWQDQPGGPGAGIRGLPAKAPKLLPQRGGPSYRDHSPAVVVDPRGLHHHGTTALRPREPSLGDADASHEGLDATHQSGVGSVVLDLHRAIQPETASHYPKPIT